jgi:4-diphosphocytidyl-2C-methyl-D-erythritol kinase
MEQPSSTGTRDAHYNLISMLYHSLQAADTCQIYLQDAHNDEELKTFLEETGETHKKIAERAKVLLASRWAQKVSQ